jgi:hypothetical protein
MVLAFAVPAGIDIFVFKDEVFLAFVLYYVDLLFGIGG